MLFSVYGKMQPFTVSMTTNALLLMDFHASLTSSEVVGYLGGTWDVHTHSKLSKEHMRRRMKGTMQKIGVKKTPAGWNF